MEVSGWWVVFILILFGVAGFAIWYVYKNPEKNPFCTPAAPASIEATSAGLTLKGVILQNGAYVLLLDTNGILAIYEKEKGILSQTPKRFTEITLKYDDPTTTLKFVGVDPADTFESVVQDTEKAGAWTLALTNDGKLVWNSPAQKAVQTIDLTTLTVT